MKYIWLISGWALISLAITYAWWVKVRVWLFRQRLFRVRDNLWYAMRDECLLEDPDYRRVREGINAMIQFAPHLSVSTLKLIGRQSISKRQSSKVHRRILDAYIDASYEMARYTLFYTASGWWILIKKFPDIQRHAIKAITSAKSKEARNAMDKDEMREIDWDHMALG